MPALIGERPLTASERSKRYYEKHKDAERERHAAWRLANPEAMREKARKAYWKDPAKQRMRKHVRRITTSEFIVLPKEMKRLYASPCSNCGSMKNQTVDHIVPLSRNGRHSIGNLQTLCFSCNTRKNTRTIMEWRMGRIAHRGVTN
jgi:5-methylcytosine-specific restriction endonuclease McrA